MEKLSGVRPALGQTRAHGGGRQNSQTESGEEKKTTKSFRQFTDTAVISQQSRSTEPQTAQSVSREPNKQFCQALKFKAIKGGGPVVPPASRLLPLDGSKLVTEAANSAANGKHQQ